MQQLAEPSQEPGQASQSQPDLVSPSPRWNRVAWRTLRLLLLALAVIVLWCITYNRWGSDFSIPTRYNFVDTDFHLAMIKIAQEGEWPLVGEVNSSSLGAPFTGNQNDFPINNRTYWLAGYLARMFGLFPAANMMMIGFHLLAAFSFYFAARLWRISRLYAWAFSIIYSTLPQFGISLNYFGVLSFGLLPLQLYTCWYIATAQKLSCQSKRFKITLLICILSGFLNIYWVYLFLQLYFLALIVRLFGRLSSSKKAALPALATILCIALFSSGHIIYSFKYGKNIHAVVRDYHSVDLFSFKPIDMLVPLQGHAFGLMKTIYEEYSEHAIGLVEGSFAYSGILAIFGLGLLAINSFRRQLKGRSLALPFVALIWIIAYSEFGGLNAIFSLFSGFYKIRGTARYAIAIGSIGFLYFTFISDRISQKWNLVPRLTLLSVIGLIGLGDHIGRPFTAARVHWSPNKITPFIDGDRVLVRRLEDSLPEDSMLFMMPVLPYPEYGWEMYTLGDYELFCPFFYSSKLRYSFGSNKGRQGADWQLDVQDLPAGEMALALESYGFAGILLNRKGYEDRGEQLLSELAEAGWPMEFEQGVDNEWVFIRLTPAEEPVLPTLTPYAVTQSK